MFVLPPLRIKRGTRGAGEMTTLLALPSTGLLRKTYGKRKRNARLAVLSGSSYWSNRKIVKSRNLLRELCDVCLVAFNLRAKVT